MNSAQLIAISALAVFAFLTIPIKERKHPFVEYDGTKQAIVETRRIGFCDVKSSSEPWYVIRGTGFTCAHAMKQAIRNI
jgi:hypothetical protein